MKNIDLEQTSVDRTDGIVAADVSRRAFLAQRSLAPVNFSGYDFFSQPVATRDSRKAVDRSFGFAVCRLHSFP